MPRHDSVLNEQRDGWPSRRLLEAAAAAGRDLPVAHAERLGRALSTCRNASDAERLATFVSSAVTAECMDRLLAAWAESPAAGGAAVGAAVAAAAHAGEQSRRTEELEIVVSGPRSATLHPRSTEQVLLELITNARTELVLITYALQGYTELRDALARAVARGVNITVVAETAEDAPRFRSDPAEALAGLNVARFRWPRVSRPSRGAALHAKLVVADRSVVLITSANLTQRASADNLEVGVVLAGGDVGQRLAEHVDALVSAGVLQRA